jgi:RNA polymerase sigma-70 factor (ECF subfamily)
LLLRAQEGDEEGLGLLLQSYRNYLHLVARTQIDLHLAARVNPSDIVQETFLQACRGFGQFRGRTQAELLTWLRQILVHNIVSAFNRHMRSQKRDVRRERSLEVIARNVDCSSQHIEAALAAQGSSPSVCAQRQELAALVADRLAELPPRYREVVVLRNLEGLTFEEVGARMGNTRQAARKLWAKAIDQLRLEPPQEP